MDKRNLILVELKDGTTCRMAKKALKVFLSQGEVVKFKRANDWFVVGSDPLRDKKKESTYDGVERREDI